MARGDIPPAVAYQARIVTLLTGIYGAESARLKGETVLAARLELALGGRDGARTRLTASAEQHETDAVDGIAYLRGDIAQAEGKTGEAEAAYLAAAKIAASPVGALGDLGGIEMKLGEVYLNTGRLPEAEHALGAAYTLLYHTAGPGSPRTAEALLLAARLAGKQGDKRREAELRARASAIFDWIDETGVRRMTL
jgi:tetratricopeptide (TPR) repeat protein